MRFKPRTLVKLSGPSALPTLFKSKTILVAHILSFTSGKRFSSTIKAN